MLFEVKIDYDKLSGQLPIGEQELKKVFTFWHAIGEHGVENS